MPPAETVDRLTLIQDVADFLYLEAELLDQHRFHEWLDLFADDVRYVAPIHESVQGQPAASNGELGYYLFNEDKGSLTMRVKRLDTGLAHVETPASVTQRLISNVRVLRILGDEVEVGSNFYVYQVHDVDEVFFVGRREDRLRGTLGSWKVAHRTIHMARPVLPRAVSIFF